MTILCTLSLPQQINGETVATVSLHTGRSGRPCGEFLMVRHPDGRTEYRATDDAQIPPDAPFADAVATVRRNHFRRTYAQLRDQFHGEAA